MPDGHDPIHPPSDPRPVLRRRGAVREAPSRPRRTELLAALVVGIVLVGSGLYMWRRPRASVVEAPPRAEPAASSGAPSSDAGAQLATADAGAPATVTLSEARVLACHDPGPTRTPSDQCDHLTPIEKALATAVERSADCVLEAASSAADRSERSGEGPARPVRGGTIEYVADVSFARRRVSVTLPRAGRSIHDRRTILACAGAVRGAMQSVSWSGVDHQHARYRIALTATYLARP